MSYESDCNDYALHGNPERDHYDYEENARYDQFDGYRESFADEHDEVYEDQRFKTDYYELGLDAGYRGIGNGAEEFDLEDADDAEYRRGYAVGSGRRKANESSDIPF